MKTRVIAIINQKGGVGKTTTCINMGACLVKMGKKVLIVDMDPQGNATTGLGVQKHIEFINELGKKDVKPALNIYTVLCGNVDILNPELIRHTEPAGLDVIPSSIDLSAIEMEMNDMPNREKVLVKAIEPLLGKYDYILFDCPPSMSLITINSMVAADSVLIPIQCEFYAMEGLAQLLDSIKIIKKLLNPKLSVDHVLLTMYSGRYKLHQQVAEEIKKYFGNRLLKTKIPVNVRLAEAPSFGKPIILYDKKCTGAVAYIRATEEFLARENKRK
ncbi:MAG: ParA family protein [Clostridia bacterium]|nr:ParA family protein [Clostridia bacterium]